MSWKTINTVLGLAMIDEDFAQKLLQTPRDALSSYGIQLALEELELLCTSQAQTLEELSELLFKKLGPESPK